MMWLRREMAKQDMERLPAPSPIENNPVGWSSIYPPPPGRVMENASPEFSPLASSAQMTNEQRLGRFWNAATGRAKPYTNADLPQLTKAGQEAYDAAAGFVNSTNPIRAYHGSPHTFDRFDMSKIGTGEGAQAYGHGLYFAGSEDVARVYKNDLSKDTLNSVSGFLGTSPWKGQPQGHAADALIAAGGDYGKAADALKKAFSGTEQRDALFALNELARLKASPAGSMYEVSLRTTPERLLDWDKPLSQQPAAVKALQDANVPLALRREAMEDTPGSGLYRMLMGRGNKPADVSQTLQTAGLDGIQYLDAGSRAAGEGSRNYVMFRDDIIDILKRYGIFGLGMVGGATAGPYGADNP